MAIGYRAAANFPALTDEAKAASAAIPTRHLRCGVQDVTVRVPKLGQVCVSVDYTPAERDSPRSASSAASR